ncbi:MAG TPA: SH3 domain-containing protein [Longilinea sp.]|nr:SH3 domain-containing protein [Longilinea sp.]
MKSIPRLLVMSFILAIAAAGCRSQATAEPTLFPTRTAGVETSQPPTPTALPTESPTVLPTSEPVTAQVATSTANLRKGPSTLDDVVGQINLGELVRVDGLAPGGEWVKVMTSGGTEGWIKGSLLNFGTQTPTLPIISITDEYVIKGKVTDASGNPLQDVLVSLNRTVGNVYFEDRMVTNADGEFYAFVPSRHVGAWNLEITGVNCTATIVDQSCHYGGTFSQDGSVTVDVPPSDSWVVFVYTP